jgi:hypothetical protein
MLCYAIFDLYPTRFSLLMQDFALVVCGAIAVVLLSVFAMGLIATVLSIILLPTYLLGVLRSAIQHPAIQKIALRLQKGVLTESKVPATAAVRFPDCAWALLFAPICRVKLWLRNVRVRLSNNDYTSIFLPIW